MQPRVLVALGVLAAIAAGARAAGNPGGRWGQLPKRWGRSPRRAAQPPKHWGQSPKRTGRRPTHAGQPSKHWGQSPKRTGQSNTPGGQGKAWPRDVPRIRLILPALAVVGQNIRVYGESFGHTRGTASVRVGGERMDCEIVHWDSNKLVIKVPEGLTRVVGGKALGARLTVRCPRAATAKFRVVDDADRPAIRKLSSPTIRPGQRLQIAGRGFLSERGGEVQLVRTIDRKQRAWVCAVLHWDDTSIHVKIDDAVRDADGGVWKVLVINRRDLRAEAKINFEPTSNGGPASPATKAQAPTPPDARP